MWKGREGGRLAGRTPSVSLSRNSFLLPAIPFIGAVRATGEKSIGRWRAHTHTHKAILEEKENAIGYLFWSGAALSNRGTKSFLVAGRARLDDSVSCGSGRCFMPPPGELEEATWRFLQLSKCRERR